MAQDRMLRQSMRTSEKVNAWPIPLRYFWTQLWGYCDDWGRGRRDPRLVVAGTFPMDEEVDSKTVERWMRALEIASVIEIYEFEGKKYFECVNWAEHQEVVYMKRTEIPDQWGVIPKAGKHSGKVLESSGKFQKSLKEVEGEVEGEVEVEGEGESVKPTPPTPFCKKHPQGTDAPCRACGNSRKLFEAATLEKKNRPTSRPPTAREIAATMCADHGDYPLPCALCREIALKAVA